MKARWNAAVVIFCLTVMVLVTASQAGILRDLSEFWFGKNQNTITTDYNVDVPGITIDGTAVTDVSTTVGDPGSDNTLVTEQAVREALAVLSSEAVRSDSLIVTNPSDGTYGGYIVKNETTGEVEIYALP